MKPPRVFSGKQSEELWSAINRVFECSTRGADGGLRLRKRRAWSIPFGDAAAAIERAGQRTLTQKVLFTEAESHD